MHPNDTPAGLPGNVYYGQTPYSIGPIYCYTACPYCGGALGGYPRLKDASGYGWYSRCHECRYGDWQHNQDAEIRERLAQGELVAA